MSQENVEIVRSIYEAFNRGDWDAAFRYTHPDFELTTPPGINAGTFRGCEECQGFWQDAITAFEAVTAEPEEIFESGEQVVAFVKTRARPKGSSAEIEIRTGHLWTFRDGKVLSLDCSRSPRRPSKPPGCGSRALTFALAAPL